MGLGKYAAASNEAVRELEVSLTSADVNALAGELGALGYPAWVRWKVANDGEITKYVEATPRVRDTRKTWLEPGLRRRLVLASIDHCQAAAALLGFLHENEYALSPGGSYRDTTALAGSLYWELVGIDIPVWPEGFEQVCPSPFGAS